MKHKEFTKKKMKKPKVGVSTMIIIKSKAEQYYIWLDQIQLKQQDQ